MNAVRRTLLGLACVIATCVPAHAHPVPFSYIDLRVESGRVELSIVVHTFDLANDLKIQPPEKLLERETLNATASAITRLIQGRLTIAADGVTLGKSTWLAPEAIADRQ